MIDFLKMLRGILCFNSLQSNLRNFRDSGLKQLRRNAYRCVNLKTEYFLSLRHNNNNTNNTNNANNNNNNNKNNNYNNNNNNNNHHNQTNHHNHNNDK